MYARSVFINRAMRLYEVNWQWVNYKRALAKVVQKQTVSLLFKQ